MRTAENFQKEQGYTDEMMDVLRDCYDNPNNEYKHLPYGEWLYELKEAEGGTIICEILEDFAEM